MAVIDHELRRALSVTAATLILCIHARADAALEWAGRTWQVTTGGMAGVAEGSASNVSVDDDGYLHLKISKSGSTWTAAELFTTDKLGFGTYQWQIDAPLDRFDKNVVLGLYPYGPAAGIGADGTNEIDIEYSFWGNSDGVNGDWTDYPASGKTIGEKSYQFSLSGGTLSTSRFVWSTSQIESSLLEGIQAVGSTTGLLNSWTYAPTNSTVNIPQQALPLGMNLWCFDNPPSDGKEVEVVIRSFQFIPEGTASGGAGAGGAGASSGGAAAGGAAPIAGAGGAHASSGGAGTSAAGSSSGTGSAGKNSAGTSGAPSAAGSANSGGSNLGSSGAGASDTGASGSDASVPVESGESRQNSSCSLGNAPVRRETTWLALLPLLALGAWCRRRTRAAVQFDCNEH